MCVYAVDADEKVRRLITHLVATTECEEVYGFETAAAAKMKFEQTLANGGNLPWLAIVGAHGDSPDEEGLALCHWVKAQPGLADTSLVVMADDDPEIVQQAFAIGAYDIVRRMKEPSELLTRLPEVIHLCATDHALKSAHTNLQREWTFHSAIVDSISNMGEGLFVVEQRKFSYVNKALCELTGYSADELYRWDHFLAIFHPSERQRLQTNHVRRLAGESFETRYNTALLCKDGSRLDIQFSVALFSTPTHNGVACLVRDIRQELAVQSYLQNLADYDQLTGLPNRRLMQDRLKQALSRAARARTQVALLFIDLDGFKAVNDGLGHAAGDELLIQVAERLKSRIRATDTAARLAGDEFVVILEADIPGELEVLAVVEGILAKVRKPYQLTAGSARVSASIGVALSDGEDVDNIELFLHRADAAMYRAKQQGKDSYFLLTKPFASDFTI